MLIPGMAKMMRLMGMNTFKPKQTMFFANIVRKTIQQRKASKERKDDLIDLMLDAMEGLKDESQEENEDQYEADMKLSHKANGKNLDEMSFIGTAMVAGYDTTGMTLSWICYELAKKKGSSVFINSPGIHSDPKYYPNPTVFNPDNFSKEAKASRGP